MASGLVRAATFSDRAKSLLDVAKDGFTILRDFALLVVFIALLFFPTQLNGVLTRAGITKVNGGVFEWQRQVQESADKSAMAGQETGASIQSLQQTKAQIQQMAAETGNPAMKRALLQVAEQMDAQLNSLSSADSTLADAYHGQKQVLASAAAAAGTPVAAGATEAGLEGWFYTGEASHDHKQWITPPPPKIDAATPQLQPGQEVTLTDSVFLRADKQPGQTFNQANIVGTIEKGSRAQVLAVAPSHALNGGDFLWMKVVVTRSK